MATMDEHRVELDNARRRIEKAARLIDQALSTGRVGLLMGAHELLVCADTGVTDVVREIRRSAEMGRV